MEAKINLVQETCCVDGCNIVFFLEDKHRDRLISTKRSFYCPNGHSQSYSGESDAQKVFSLNRELMEKDTTIRQKDWEIERLSKLIPKKKKAKKKAKKK